MTEKLYLFESTSLDPHYNLAMEQHLLDSVGEGEAILYLWQNRSTVVIGRNQNPWKECRVTHLEAAGGSLARRLSGGGAVFHDVGNLNFTFLLPTADYNLAKQLQVIVSACRSLGVPAELSGRNDLTAAGQKFSGNAFYHHRGKSYHHGTLLVDVDMDSLSRYLMPSPAKLQAKGVDSVRSRVVNLAALVPELTILQLKAALSRSFCAVYGLPLEPWPAARLDKAAIHALREHNRSWEWRFGTGLPFDFSCGTRFPWGEITLELAVQHGIIHHCAVWTDAMEWSLSDTLTAALVDCPFTVQAMTEKITAGAVPHGEDICTLLTEQDI